MPRTHTVPWVVLDANALCGKDPYLESAAGRLLRDAASEQRVRVAIPEVVMVEAEANHAREERRARQDLKDAQARLARLRAPQDHDLKPRRLSYREDMEAMLAEVDGRVLPLPTVGHSELVRMAATRRRPFNANGDGYRDALIWFSVLELLEIEIDPVILISEDKRAFHADQKESIRLAPDLIEHLRRFGHHGRVSLHKSLAEFTQQMPEAQKLVGQWTAIFEQNEELHDALLDYMTHLAESEADALIGSATITPIPGMVRNAHFTSFDEPRDLEVAEVWVSDDGQALLEVSLILNYAQTYDVILPNNQTAFRVNTVSVKGSQQGSLRLLAEIYQRDRSKPTRFTGRLTGWAAEGEDYADFQIPDRIRPGR